MISVKLGHAGLISTHKDWKAAKAEAFRLVDRLGEPLDKKILIAVTALRAYGLNTTASCQGHLSWGEPAPWIDIGVTIHPPNSRTKATQLSGPKVKSARSLRRTNLLSQERLLALLEAFYQSHAVPADVHLVVIPIGIFGGFRLTNQGAAIQSLHSNQGKKKKLTQFQME